MLRGQCAAWAIPGLPLCSTAAVDQEVKQRTHASAHRCAANDKRCPICQRPVSPCAAGLPELKDKVIEATQAHQRGQAAQDYALALAAIFERVLLGHSVAAAVADAASAVPAATQGALRTAQAQPRSSQADVVQVRRELPRCSCINRLRPAGATANIEANRGASMRQKS